MLVAESATWSLLPSPSPQKRQILMILKKKLKEISYRGMKPNLICRKRSINPSLTRSAQLLL